MKNVYVFAFIFSVGSINITQCSEKRTLPLNPLAQKFQPPPNYGAICPPTTSQPQGYSVFAGNPFSQPCPTPKLQSTRKKIQSKIKVLPRNQGQYFNVNYEYRPWSTNTQQQ